MAGEKQPNLSDLMHAKAAEAAIGHQPVQAPAVPKTRTDEGGDSAQQARVLPDEQQLIARDVKPGDGLAVPPPEIGPPQEASSGKDVSQHAPGNLSDLLKQQVVKVGQDFKRAGVRLNQQTPSSEQAKAHENKTPDRTPRQDNSRDHGRSR